MMPSGICGVISSSMVGRLRDLMPKPSRTRPVRRSCREGTLDELPKILSAGRKTAADSSPLRWCSRRIRNRHAQHRHLPHAGVRRPHDRHALAAAQGRRAASPRRRAAGKRLDVAVALSPEPVLPYCATAPMPEGLDELLLGGFLSRTADRDGEMRHGRSRSAGERAHRARGLRRAGERRREGPFGDHTGFYSQPDDYPCSTSPASRSERSRPI